jgi:hypothetical protein
MILKRAESLNFTCRNCGYRLHEIRDAEWGCVGDTCFNNFHQMEYRVKLGLIPKNRL